MAERRTARGGADGKTSIRRRRPADRDDQEILDDEEMVDDEEMIDEEPEVGEEDALPDPDEPDGADDDISDESLDADEPERADEDRPAGNGRRRPARPRRPARSRRPAMSAVEAARAAARQIAELTAKQPEGVTGVERTEDGWTVGIELLEDQRIPSSSDILATYEVTIDADGEMESYRRIKRYARGRGDTEDY